MTDFISNIIGKGKINEKYEYLDDYISSNISLYDNKKNKFNKKDKVSDNFDLFDRSGHPIFCDISPLESKNGYNKEAFLVHMINSEGGHFEKVFLKNPDLSYKCVLSYDIPEFQLIEEHRDREFDKKEHSKLEKMEQIVSTHLFSWNKKKKYFLKFKSPNYPGQMNIDFETNIAKVDFGSTSMKVMPTSFFSMKAKLNNSGNVEIHKKWKIDGIDYFLNNQLKMFLKYKETPTLESILANLPNLKKTNENNNLLGSLNEHSNEYPNDINSQKKIVESQIIQLLNDKEGILKYFDIYGVTGKGSQDLQKFKETISDVEKKINENLLDKNDINIEGMILTLKSLKSYANTMENTFNSRVINPDNSANVNNWVRSIGKNFIEVQKSIIETPYDFKNPKHPENLGRCGETEMLNYTREMIFDYSKFMLVQYQNAIHASQYDLADNIYIALADYINFFAYSYTDIDKNQSLLMQILDDSGKESRTFISDIKNIVKSIRNNDINNCKISNKKVMESILPDLKACSLENTTFPNKEINIISNIRDSFFLSAEKYILKCFPDGEKSSGYIKNINAISVWLSENIDNNKNYSVSAYHNNVFDEQILNELRKIDNVQGSLFFVYSEYLYIENAANKIKKDQNSSTSLYVSDQNHIEVRRAELLKKQKDFIDQYEKIKEDSGGLRIPIHDIINILELKIDIDDIMNHDDYEKFGNIVYAINRGLLSQENELNFKLFLYKRYAVSIFGNSILDNTGSLAIEKLDSIFEEVDKSLTNISDKIGPNDDILIHMLNFKHATNLEFILTEIKNKYDYYKFFSKSDEKIISRIFDDNKVYFGTQKEDYKKGLLNDIFELNDQCIQTDLLNFITLPVVKKKLSELLKIPESKEFLNVSKTSTFQEQIIKHQILNNPELVDQFLSICVNRAFGKLDLLVRDCMQNGGIPDQEYDKLKQQFQKLEKNIGQGAYKEIQKIDPINKFVGKDGQIFLDKMNLSILSPQEIEAISRPSKDGSTISQLTNVRQTHLLSNTRNIQNIRQG